MRLPEHQTAVIASGFVRQMGASVCDYCGTELSKIDKAVAVDSKIHLKQQINLQARQLPFACVSTTSR